MLETVESVPWSTVHGPYGEVSEMPQFLRAAAAGEALAAQAALSLVLDRIIHQGTRWQSTSVTVPFLFEILKDPSCTVRREIAWCLQDLATDEITPFFPKGFDPGEFFAEAKTIVLDPQDVEEIWGKADWDTLSEQQWKIANGMPLRYHYDAYTAVEQGSDCFIALAADSDPNVRMAAIRSLVYFPKVALKALPAIRLAADLETEPFLLSNAVMVLGLVCRYAKVHDEVMWLEKMLSSNDQVVQIMAAIALGAILGPEIPDPALMILVNATEEDIGLLSMYTERLRLRTSLRGYVWQVLHALGL